MTEATTAPSTLTIGIDLGDRKSHVCVLDADGEVVEESQIATTPKALRTRFECLAPTLVAFEVGGHSAWVCELLKEVDHEVIVANARNAARSSRATRRTTSWTPSNWHAWHEWIRSCCTRSSTGSGPRERTWQ